MSTALIISILSGAIGFLSLLFSIFLITVKSENKISNLLIAGFLMLTAFDISVYYYADWIQFPPSIEMLRVRLSAFKSPLLFLYILSVVNNDFKFKPIHLLNAVPFLIDILILLPNFFLASRSQQELFFANYFDNPEIKWIAIFSYSISVLYILASLWVVKRYRALLLENYATDQALTNYRFLSQLILFIIVGFTLTSIKEIFLFNAEQNIINASRVVMLSYGLFFMSWLVLKALLSPKLFRGVSSKMKLAKEFIKEEEQVTLNKTSEEDELTQQIKTLRAYMEEHEPYLSPDLTINELSKLIGLPARELSILINHHLDQHFFDFINEYRIKKAMHLLRAPAYKKHTILEILFEVGFNSKSPFNTAFKKFTNLTPSQYRLSNSKSST